MSDDTSDTVIIEVDSEDGNFSGAEEQDDNANNMEQEDNYQADDEQRDEDEQGEDEQDNDNTNIDNNVTNVSVQKNETTAAPQTQKCEQSNEKNEKKKWEKKKNCKATGKGGNNNQNGNANKINQNGNANNKNNNNNNDNQPKNKDNSQQNNNSNQPKNSQNNNNQNKPNHQNNNSNNNNNYNNKNNNSNSDKNNQDNKFKGQSGENKNNNHGNQSKPNNQNNNNGQNNNNNKSNSSYNNSSNNNQNKPNNNNNNSSNNNNKDNNNNKEGSNKGSGVGAQDILKTLRGLIQGPKKYEKPWPLDSFVLRLHYRMGVAIFLLGFLSIKGNWYWRDNIVARSLYNAEKHIETIYENICLSYPFVEVVSGEIPEVIITTRRYLLYYRWVYWSFLLFAGIFYIPRALAKRMDNSRLRKLLEELHSQESRYDANGWDKNCDTIISYLHRHQGTHLGLYFNLVICHLFALVIDLGTILFFDFILDGHFLFLLYHVWPLNRDPQNFQDPLSSAFPPFAMCEITPGMKIMGERTEQYGIHLAHMEMYEKVFLMLWIWLLVMLCLVALKILALFIMFLPFTHWLFLGTSKSNKSIRKMKRFVLKTYGLGDIYAIFVIKKHMSDAEFRYLLSKLSKIEEVTEKKVKLDKDDVKTLDDDPDQCTGNYQRNINNQWIIDEFQPNAPPDVTFPPNLTLGDYFPVDYLRQRRIASTPKPPDEPVKPPPTQPVVPAFPINDPVTGQPRYGWNNSIYQQACYDQSNGKTPQKCLPSHAV